MWPPPLSLGASTLLKHTHEVWCRVLQSVDTQVWLPPLRTVLQTCSQQAVLPQTLTCPHAMLGGTQCPRLCHALHTDNLGHALTNLGPSEPKNHIALLVLSQAAGETWISCHTAGTGPVPLESLALDWMTFSSTEGLQTQPVSCFTWISFILSDGASISTLLPVAFNLCPQGGLLPTQFKVLTGTGTADSDTAAEPAVTDTRAELPTPTAAPSTVCTRMAAHNTLLL